MASLMLMKRNLFTTPKRMYSAAAGAGGHGGGMKLWKNLSIFGAVPACILMAVKVYLDHQKDHECHERPEFIPYEHLRIRTKRFPWGDGNHSLFHNPHTNALPDGYEDEEHH